jgi:uncharacterized membrane protein
VNNYLLGIGYALLAGISFNASYLMQKLVINKTGNKDRIFGDLIRNPFWIFAIFLQVVVGGIILYPLAQLYLGPSLVPGFLSVGMIILAIGSAVFLKESLSILEKMGIIIIIVSIFLLSMSKLKINIANYDFMESGFLMRLVVFNLVYITLIVLLFIFQSVFSTKKDILRIIISGILGALSNLWLSIIIGLMGHFSKGSFIFEEMILFTVAAIIMCITSLLPIYVMQKAFQLGRPSILIPIQSIPVQVTPVLLYFFLFNSRANDPKALCFISFGAVGILTGYFFLAKRKVDLA